MLGIARDELLSADIIEKIALLGSRIVEAPLRQGALLVGAAGSQGDELRFVLDSLHDAAAGICVGSNAANGIDRRIAQLFEVGNIVGLSC